MNPAAAPADRPGPTRPIRVVVVDDHPVVRDGLIGIFEAEPGIEVVGEAAGGDIALAVIATADPDVVLMDLRMPEGDGIGTIRRLRAARRDRPRVLVLTTFDTDREVRSALEAGADGFLLKDVGRAELVRAVGDLAAGRPVLAPSALAVLAGRCDTPELTDRELEVLRLIAAGHTNRAAADRMLVSEATVKTHLVHAYQKLSVNDRAAAVRVGYERGLL